MITPGKLLEKDPSASKLYQFDWSAWLGDAQIADKAVSVVADDFGDSDGVLTATDVTLAAGNQKVDVTVSGGTVGLIYRVVCRITTNESPAQTDERSITIRVRDL